MSTPNPVDLFINLWSREMHDEEGVRPGSKEWSDNQKNVYNYWTRVWMECKEVCKHIQNFEQLSEECKSALRAGEE